MKIVTALEEVLANTAPMTEDEIARSMRVIGRRAWEASQELHGVAERIGEANADAEKTYNDALIASHVEHPERRVAHHKAIAEQAAQDHRATVFALTHMERALIRECEILDRLVTSCQTQWKHLVGEEVPYPQRGAA